MSAWVVDLRDRQAQRLVNDHNLESEPPRFIVVEADSVSEAFAKARGQAVPS